MSILCIRVQVIGSNRSPRRHNLGPVCSRVLEGPKDLMRESLRESWKASLRELEIERELVRDLEKELY